MAVARSRAEWGRTVAAVSWLHSAIAGTAPGAADIAPGVFDDAELPEPVAKTEAQLAAESAAAWAQMGAVLRRGV